MILSEEQAREKWCPMARVSHGVTGRTVNRWGANETWAGGPLTTYCIASHCMMWRWHEAAGFAHDGTWQGPGYCGLAGEP